MPSRRIVPLVVAAGLPVILLLILARGLTAGLAMGAPGGMFTVTKTADTGDGVCDADCSLREAIGAANTSAGHDTIVLPAGIYVLTLAPAGVDDDANLFGDLDSSDDLTLSGAGASTTVIDGGGSLYRVLHSLAGSLTLTDVTVTGGTAFDEGAGIYAAGDLTLENSTVYSNVVQGGDGGGVYARGNVIIKGSTIHGNSAGINGGGAAVYGSLTVLSSTIQQNEADMGGGLYISGTVAITGSVLMSNTANNNGGGLYTFVTTATAPLLSGPGSTAGITSLAPNGVRQRPVNLYNSTLSNNTSTNGDGGGAAVEGDAFSFASLMTVREMQLRSNKALNGCGGALHTADLTLEVNDSDFTENISMGSGAICISNSERIPATVYRSRFYANTTYSGLGAVGGENVDALIDANQFLQNGTNHLSLHGNGVVRNNVFTGASELGPMVILHGKGPPVNWALIYNNFFAREQTEPGPFGGTVAVELGGEGDFILTHNIVCGPYIAYRNAVKGAINALVDYYLYHKVANMTDGDFDVGDHIYNADPMFVDPENDDLHLLPGSPAIDAGSPTDLDNIPEYDLDLQMRPIDGDGDGQADYDIGADEWSGVPPDFRTLLPYIVGP